MPWRIRLRLRVISPIDSSDVRKSTVMLARCSAGLRSSW
jgi:hypothetical protein